MFQIEKNRSHVLYFPMDVLFPEGAGRHGKRVIEVEGTDVRWVEASLTAENGRPEIKVLITPDQLGTFGMSVNQDTIEFEVVDHIHGRPCIQLTPDMIQEMEQDIIDEM